MFLYAQAFRGSGEAGSWKSLRVEQCKLRCLSGGVPERTWKGFLPTRLVVGYLVLIISMYYVACALLFRSPLCSHRWRN